MAFSYAVECQSSAPCSATENADCRAFLAKLQAVLACHAGNLDRLPTTGLRFRGDTLAHVHTGVDQLQKLRSGLACEVNREAQVLTTISVD